MSCLSIGGCAWLFGAARLREQRVPFVMVTVIRTRGSVPREAGTRMLVTPRDTVGTIGGGHLEHEAIAIARRRLQAADMGAHWQGFALGASLGQCCGGAVELMFEFETGTGLGWIDVLLQALQRSEPAVIGSVIDDGTHTCLAMAPSGDRWQRGEGDAAMRRLARERLAIPGPVPAELLQQPGKTGERTGARRFVQRIDPPSLNVWLYGAGHVGQALVSVLGLLPCCVTWVDGRAEAFPGQVPENVRVVCSDGVEREVDDAPMGACHVVMTHSHALDFDLSLRILQRADFRYFGLIGSATKRRSFEHRLLARGLAREQLARMRCPIGIDGVTGKEPGVIAVAVAAQLLGLRDPAAPGPAPMALRDARVPSGQAHG